jgi:2-polyprenyl-3-methyl-5-hydroxy-6-metoxy-1,4-benzoquinol methylase
MRAGGAGGANPVSKTAVGSAASFSYEAKTWGAARLEPRRWFMNGLKLRYLLADLRSVHGKVLDVGCGAGSVAKAVKRARPDLEVMGCDVSEAALAAAMADSDGVVFQRAQAERLPFADGEVDFVWIFDVLEHARWRGFCARAEASISCCPSRAAAFCTAWSAAVRGGLPRSDTGAISRSFPLLGTGS